MNNSIVSLLLIQIILIALNAVFASAELAVLSVNESKINRLAERGSKKARRLRKLLKEPAKFLSTIQIAITLSGFLGSAFAADGFSDPLVDWLVGLGATLSRNTLDTLSVIFITHVMHPLYCVSFGSRQTALEKLRWYLNQSHSYEQNHLWDVSLSCEYRSWQSDFSNGRSRITAWVARSLLERSWRTVPVARCITNVWANSPYLYQSPAVLLPVLCR